MTISGRRVMLRVALVLAVCVIAFVALEHPARVLESQAVAALLGLLGAHESQVVLETNVAILADGEWLLATITPSCSAIASVLAIACLGLVAPVGRLRRRLLALSLTLTIIAVGNLLRMTASLGLGIVAGRDALVLFHDWVGGLFTFTYTLLGYVLFIYLMLPKRRSTMVRADAVPA